MNIIQTKKVKNIDKTNISQDVAWIKTLLHPSMEKNFIRFEVVSIIVATKTKLILNIKPNPSSFPEFETLTGFFDVWWWKNSLSKVEFSTIQEISKNFEFLRRIINNENILSKNVSFALLLNAPKLIRDETDYQRGLLTCKRFLIIE